MKKKIIIPVKWIFIPLAFAIFSCATNPYASTNKAHRKQSQEFTKQLNTFPPERTPADALIPYGKDWVGTTNFNLRKPNFVIIHHTAQDSVQQTLSTFTMPRTSVSSHYVIGKNGEVYHMLNDYYRAWHAGAGKWGNTNDLNSASLGIELDNTGEESFSSAQIMSLLQLLGVLKEKYNIPAANFIGHSDIAPSRKIDPNPTFPWKLLAEAGFGLWYDEEIPDFPKVVDARQLLTETAVDTVETKKSSADKEIEVINPELALRIIGYDTSNLPAAISAFKLHFIQNEVNSELTDEDLKILNNLYKKYM